MEPELARLSGRIESEFNLSRERLRSIRHQEPADHRHRQTRLMLYEAVCRSLQEIWEPRLQAVRQRLKDGLKVPIAIRINRRQAGLSFASSLARIRLAFTAMIDADVRTVILEYGLEIVPSLVSVPTLDRFELPLQQFDGRRIEEWVDDRVVSFVRTYLSLYENEYNLGALIVEDPVAHVRFPKAAAVSTVERQGKTFYFISDATRDDFDARESRRELDPSGV